MKSLLWRHIFTARSPGRIIFSSSHFCYLWLISQSLRENILMAGTCGGPDGTFLVTPNVPYDQSFTEVCSGVMIPALGCLLEREEENRWCTGRLTGREWLHTNWQWTLRLETLSFWGGSNDLLLREEVGISYEQCGVGSQKWEKEEKIIRTP